jgi:hypothetical protein
MCIGYYRILCNPFAGPSNGNYLQTTANVPLICLVGNATENFLHVLICFLKWMVQARGTKGSMFPLCNNNAFRHCVEESMNSRHCSGLYLVFTAATTASTFLQALVHLVLWRPHNLFVGTKCCLFHSVIQKVPPLKILKTTVLFYSLTVLGLWWDQTVLYVSSCVVQQRLCSRKTPDLFKLMAVVFLQVHPPLPHHSLAKNCQGVLE